MRFRLLLLIPITLLCLGFRPVSPEEHARKILKDSDTLFGIREYAELYGYVRVTKTGEVFQGKMLLIYRYKDDAVTGIFRILPDDDNKGVTLISHQTSKDLPELEIYDHNTQQGGHVPIADIGQKLGDTDWFLEGIFDDDKNAWTYRRANTIDYRGYTVDVIDASYTNDQLKRAVPYDHRRMLIRKDNQPLASEFYDYDGKLIYVIDLLSSEHFEYMGEDKARAKQIQIIDVKNGSTTIFTRVRSNWNPQLPDELFELAFANDWNEETDRMITTKLLRDLPATHKQ